MTTQTFEETQKEGKEFAKKLFALENNSKATVVVLYGELGSGKTTFVQGFAKELGIKKRIISPTFIIVRKYRVRIKDKGLMIKNFYHVDLYRANSEKDLEGLGLKEILEDPQNIVAIEWGEKLGSLLPKKRWDVRFEYLDKDKRKITINEQY